ncbi:DUF4163 domain-containing protein [Bacillus sp. V5-8f]|uniref:DUF4163 domain-containing protein n=1 Tax=Bacillus sp. V5-8f TaxID=2053044 RepID=UPI000C78453F|nr:DUF4163 domain-containing protein [Bacillus sp. V5-8f]PLT32090.1 hypothetical protein CUU64_21225 [Bacillus sp. V5-8f]
MKKLFLTTLFFAIILSFTFSTQTDAASGFKVVPYKYNKIEDLKYPQVNGLQNKTMEKKINNILLNEIKKSYKEYYELEKFKQEEPDYTGDWYHTTKYSIKYNDGKTLSVLFFTDTYGGGARNHIYVKSYNFNMSSGTEIKLDNLMTTNAKKQKLVNYINNLSKKHDIFPEAYNYQDLKTSSEFVYTKGGIILNFQEYTAWASSEMPVIKVAQSIYK